MDALKKAEQEKRESARKLEESGSIPEMQDAGGMTDQHPVDPAAEPTYARPLELSLEPVSGEFAAPEQPAPESATEAPTLNVTGEQMQSMRLNTSQPLPQSTAPPTPSGLAAELVQEDEFDGDMTFQGFDDKPAAPAPIPGMFEETVAGDMDAPSESRGYDETLPGVSALQLARDIGTRDQPTPVAAETVFIAGSRKDGSGGAIKWVLGGLTLVMLIAAGAWYYLAVTPVARTVPSPWVARGIESVPVVRPEELLPPAADGEIAGAVPVPEAVTQPSPAAPVAGVPETSVPVGVVAASETPAVPAVVAEVTTAPQAPPAEPAEPPAPVQPAANEPDLAPAQVAPSISAVAPSLVQIRRESEPSSIERMVREAYGRYQANDFSGARTLYAAVLQEEPDNIDGLLGLGAVALREGDTAGAVQAHGRVLQLDPDNDTALAVLVGLNKTADLNAAESAINTLIRQSPDQPFLHFTLGNVYAAQGRWPEAQQAFFDAYRTEPGNPDYAMNLAVSLDRLGQRQPALDYYNTALRLAEQQPSGFDPAAILARIQSLNTTTTP